MRSATRWTACATPQSVRIGCQRGAVNSAPLRARRAAEAALELATAGAQPGARAAGEALEREPTKARIVDYLTILDVRDGNPRRAIERLNAIFESGTAPLPLLLIRARLLADLALWEPAEQDAKRVFEAALGLPGVAELLVTIYRSQHRIDSATATLETASKKVARRRAALPIGRLHAEGPHGSRHRTPSSTRGAARPPRENDLPRTRLCRTRSQRALSRRRTPKSSAFRDCRHTRRLYLQRASSRQQSSSIATHSNWPRQASARRPVASPSRPRAEGREPQRRRSARVRAGAGRRSRVSRGRAGEAGNRSRARRAGRQREPGLTATTGSARRWPSVRIDRSP